MPFAIDSALSGLAAATRRIEVSASNIANQSSAATVVNGVTVGKAYIPKDVVQISLGAGGVRTEVRDAESPHVKLYQPEDPKADKKGFVTTPDVDVAKQLVEQQIASYDYKANLKAIKIAGSLEENLLDMLS